MSAAERRLFLYINMGMCFCLLYLIKIFKMAAELYYTLPGYRKRPRTVYFDTANANKRCVRVHGGQSSEFPIYPTTLERTKSYTM